MPAGGVAADDDPVAIHGGVAAASRHEAGDVLGLGLPAGLRRGAGSWRPRRRSRRQRGPGRSRPTVRRNRPSSSPRGPAPRPGLARPVRPSVHLGDLLTVGPVDDRRGQDHRRSRLDIGPVRHRLGRRGRGLGPRPLGGCAGIVTGEDDRSGHREGGDEHDGDQEWEPCGHASTLAEERTSCRPVSRDRTRLAPGRAPGQSGYPLWPGLSDGGRDRRRSGDLPLFRRSLCQLSYPTRACPSPGARGRSVAVPTGFEPATSGLTGRRALQTAPRDQTLNLHPQRDSNPCYLRERQAS